MNVNYRPSGRHQESRKRGAPPASPAFLKNLANQAAEEAFPETFAEEACPICQAEYERGDVVNVMAPHCDHAFHRDCIHHWLRMVRRPGDLPVPVLA